MNPNMQQQPLTGGGQAGGGHAAQMQKMMRNQKMDLLWFIAAVAVMLGGLIGALDLLFTTFAPLDFLDEVYLLFFGFIMFVNDAPLKVSVILEVKEAIKKYCKFLTRLTGRGVWFIFLGTMTFATLWENSISYFLAVVLGFFVFGVGLFSAVWGYLKSRKLERVRFMVFEEKQKGGLKKLYDEFARTNPQMGLTSQEFNDMSSGRKGISFDKDELAAIFNALINEPRREQISFDDMSDWSSGSMTYL